MKIITFKDISLPTNLEIFLERHITSLRGASLIRSSNHSSYPEHEMQIQVDDTNTNLRLNDVSSKDNPVENVIHSQPRKCPLCSNGETPTINVAHKCYKCGKPVHAIPSCSTHRFGEDDVRIYFTCFDNETYLRDEDKHLESWKRRSDKLFKFIPGSKSTYKSY